MEIDLNNLPEQKSSLQDIIAVLASQNKDLLECNHKINKNYKSIQSKYKVLYTAHNTKIRELLEENLKLKEQLTLWRAKSFGQKSEKLKKQIENLALQVEDNEISLGLSQALESLNSSEKKNTKPRRQKLPNHLPREKVVLEAGDTCPECGDKDLRVLGEDICEKMEYVPARIKVIQYIRPRCACRKCDHIFQAAPVSNGIDKGIAGPGLLSHIIVQKYCDHLPIYRQSDIFARTGIELAESTMASWVHQCSQLLEPVVEELVKHIFAAQKLHADDTPIKVLAPGTGKTKVGRIWTYVLDGRAHGDITSPAVCYYYSPDRLGSRPEGHLASFSGVLQADAYAGYNGVYHSETKPENTIYEACCWAHVRRKFYEITVSSDNALIAHEVIEQIGKVYAVESEVRGASPAVRLAAREDKSKALVEELFISFKKVKNKLPQKGSTVKAINYALNNEVALKRFLEDGTIEIDNNIAERSLRSVAVGRKNWLFAGSDYGGESAAKIYTIIETCKLNNIDPWSYIRKVLSVIQDYNSQKISELLPWNIKIE